MILGDVYDRRTASTLAPLEMAYEMSLGDHSPPTLIPVESTTPYVELYLPGASRAPR